MIIICIRGMEDLVSKKIIIIVSQPRDISIPMMIILLIKIESKLKDRMLWLIYSISMDIIAMEILISTTNKIQSIKEKKLKLILNIIAILKMLVINFISIMILKEMIKEILFMIILQMIIK